MVNKHKLKDTDGGDWRPNTIFSLESHLSKYLLVNNNFENTYALGKNISYNLQHIEFINKILQDINLTSVLFIQNVKTTVIIGSSIIESILFYSVKSAGRLNKTPWIKFTNYSSNEYEIEKSRFKTETTILKKAEYLIEETITFDQLAKKTESFKLLGPTFPYSKLNALRKLRNKVHLQNIEHNYDTDWNNFSFKELKLVNNLLHTLLTSEYLFNYDYDKTCFEFLLWVT